MRSLGVGLVSVGFLAQMVFGLFVFRWPWFVNRMTFAAQAAVVCGLVLLAVSLLAQRTRWGVTWAAVVGAFGVVQFLVLLRGLHLAHIL